MSPADEMNRPLLAAGTPFADAAGRVAAYGLGKTRSYQLEVSLARKTGSYPFAWCAVTAICEALERIDSAQSEVQAVVDTRSSLSHQS
jgi:hypothetical protein